MRKLFYLALCMLPLLFVSCEEKEIKVNVMSFNIRLDHTGDSLNQWPYRKDVAAQIVKDQQIDIMGTQEVMHHQLTDLLERLPDYKAIGVGRADGKEKGEYSAIFYKKDRFDEVESGTFWLSETPEVAGSKGWDGACERVATWAVLKDKESGKQLFAINTHLDHVGKVARQEGVTLLLTRAKELSKGLPVIVTGDFNAKHESDVIRHVLDEENPMQMFDSRAIATSKDNAEWTFHDFGRLPESKRSYIDYIFVSKGITVDEYSVMPEKLNDIYLSDHCPIVAKLTIK
ncbi:endonuclease/exonuclease/phosphatase family protein [Dysgonomonas sp. 25]|uniref:endonuclease/exonuclease/phosphatase family protein n=1 Tax=Dysgonomonas sp. 25 TaxID=2302933 RepID=UPI0013D0280B|nr:endonuclease/exonuclease/phosphatase family protein [Dysgonomonas sp. 25]NDV69310.1 endonuclease [Dysgonomonas sp. 25]